MRSGRTGVAAIVLGAGLMLAACTSPGASPSASDEMMEHPSASDEMMEHPSASDEMMEDPSPS
jgi:hypothetical protein